MFSRVMVCLCDLNLLLRETWAVLCDTAHDLDHAHPLQTPCPISLTGYSNASETDQARSLQRKLQLLLPLSFSDELVCRVRMYRGF
jgi:hypothetical protein